MTNISSGIKAVLFDFDTLIVHKESYEAKEAKKNTKEEFEALCNHPEDYYETFDPCSPDPDMEEVVKWCRLTGRWMYTVGVSGTCAEESFLRKHYGEDITVLPPGGHDRAAEYILDINGILPRDILYVSNDSGDSREMQAKVGVVTVSSDTKLLVDNVPISDRIRELENIRDKIKRMEDMNGGTWYRKLEPGKVYGIPLADGVLRIDVSMDPQYPGIDIEYIRNDEKDDYITRPRVVIESPKEGEGIRALVWGDPRSEDYSEEIELS